MSMDSNVGPHPDFEPPRKWSRWTSITAPRPVLIDEAASALVGHPVRRLSDAYGNPIDNYEPRSWMRPYAPNPNRHRHIIEGWEGKRPSIIGSMRASFSGGGRERSESTDLEASTKRSVESTVRGKEESVVWKSEYSDGASFKTMPSAPDKDSILTVAPPLPTKNMPDQSEVNDHETVATLVSPELPHKGAINAWYEPSKQANSAEPVMTEDEEKRKEMLKELALAAGIISAVD